MSYDPCGTQRLDGDEIIRRVAVELNIDVKILRAALIKAAGIEERQEK